MHSWTSADVVAVIAAVSISLIPAIANAVLTVRNGRKIDQVHNSVNGNAAAMNSLTAASSYAKGQLDGPNQAGERWPPAANQQKGP